jgi:hypothetical protein
MNCDQEKQTNFNRSFFIMKIVVILVISNLQNAACIEQQNLQLIIAL